MKAVLRGIRLTPKKANLVAGLVRGKPVKEALAILRFIPKKGAHIISKVIKSAAANAKTNFGQSIDDLKVSEIWCVKGPTLKRGTPANRGRIWPIHEVMSHITVIVASMSGVAPKKVPHKVPAAKPSSAPSLHKASKDAMEASSEKTIKSEVKPEKKEKAPKKTTKASTRSASDEKESN